MKRLVKKKLIEYATSHSPHLHPRVKTSTIKSSKHYFLRYFSLKEYSYYISLYDFKTISLVYGYCYGFVLGCVAVCYFSCRSFFWHRYWVCLFLHYHVSDNSWYHNTWEFVGGEIFYPPNKATLLLCAQNIFYRLWGGIMRHNTLVFAGRRGVTCVEYCYFLWYFAPLYDHPS